MAIIPCYVKASLVVETLRDKSVLVCFEQTGINHFILFDV